MPTVPNLEAPQVQAEGLPGRAIPRIDTDVSAQDFGSGLAQGGEAVGAAGAEQEATLKRQNDQLRVIDANSQLEAAKTAMLYGQQQSDGTRTGGAFSLHGTDAIDMPNKILPQYDQVAQKIAGTLTPDQQRLFQAHIDLGKNELNTSLNRYEYEEGNRLADQVFTNGVKQTISNATVGWKDPLAIAKAREDLQGLVTMQGDREGWSKDERAQQLAKMQAEMHFNVVDRMLADGSPGSALSYFKGIRDTGELTGEQSHQLGAQIDAAFREHQSQNQTALLTQIRDVSTAAVNGQAIPPSQMPSRASVIAAFPEDGETRWRAMQNDITMGADMKSFAGMTPAQIQAKVESYKPSTVVGAAEQYERLNAVQTAAQRTLSARAQDPRQYAIDNNLGSQPLNFSDMQSATAELKSRLAATQTDSQRLGGYVPPMSRAEAAKLSQSLETMTPADKLRTLAGFNQGLGDDRGFQAVMHQVLPGSPVTAIVGSQLGQTNPNNVPVWFDRQFAPTPTDQTRILAGEALINPQGQEKQGEAKGGIKSFPMPSDGGPNGLREQFSTKVGDLFRDRPELGDAYFSAFKAAYAQLLSEKGDMSGNGSTTLRDQAIKMAIGNTQQVNGRAVAVPPGMDPSRFQSILDAAIHKNAIAGGAQPGFESKISGYQVVEIGGLGSGRYQLVNGNAPLVNPSGHGVFEVNLHDQYMASAGARPAPTDVARLSQAQQGAAPAAPAPSVAGNPNVGKVDIGAERIAKAPAVEGLSRGQGRPHPSQGPSTQ
jgi:hypothetical protein